MKNRPQGVLFDFGDTLMETVSWDPDVGCRRLLDLAVQPHSVTLEQMNQCRGQIEEQLQQHRDGSCLEFHVRSFQRLLFDLLGLRFDLSLDQLEREFWNATIAVKPESGVRAMLQRLSDENIPAGIVSNTMFSAETMLEELRKHDLEKYFRFLLSSADYGLRKPHPAFLLAAAKRLGVEPENIWFVGDWRIYDVAGAKAAGMTAVWYHRAERPNEGPEPDLEVDGWDAFLEQLNRT